MLTNIPFPVLVMEGGLLVLVLTLLLYIRKRVGSVDALLWALAWCTRVLSSLNGSSQFGAAGAALDAYVGLQACSAIALVLILLRSELRIFREKWTKRIMLQVAGDGVERFSLEQEAEVTRSDGWTGHAHGRQDDPCLPPVEETHPRVCLTRVDSKTGPLFGEVHSWIPDGSPAAVGKLTTATHAVTEA